MKNPTSKSLSMPNRRARSFCQALALLFIPAFLLTFYERNFADDVPTTNTVVQGDGKLYEIPPNPEKSIEAEVEIGLMKKNPSLKDKFSFEYLESIGGESSLIPIFKKGGPIMWPLLIASVLAMGTVIDRLFFLVSVRGRRDPAGMARFLAAVSKGDLDSAIAIGGKSRFYVLRTLSYALSHREKSIQNALLYAQQREMKRFRRGIPILDTIITLAPLLGLLGTVTGMMGSFALIGGELSAPGAVTGGIAEALIATAFGLGIAITSLLPFNYLNTKMEEAHMEMEAAATQLELLILPHLKSASVRKRDALKGITR